MIDLEMKEKIAQLTLDIKKISDNVMEILESEDDEVPIHPTEKDWAIQSGTLCVALFCFLYKIGSISEETAKIIISEASTVSSIVNDSESSSFEEDIKAFEEVYGSSISNKNIEMIYNDLNKRTKLFMEELEITV